MRLYHLEDEEAETETVLIVPIEDQKSINKQYVLQNSALLKKYFNIPTETLNNSLTYSNRFFRNDKDKGSAPNSSRMLHMFSNRSIQRHKMSKFKMTAVDSDESAKVVVNPFLSHQAKELSEKTVQIRKRRRTSGATSGKARALPLDW